MCEMIQTNGARNSLFLEANEEGLASIQIILLNLSWKLIGTRSSINWLGHDACAKRLRNKQREENYAGKSDMSMAKCMTEFSQSFASANSVLSKYELMVQPRVFAVMENMWRNHDIHL